MYIHTHNNRNMFIHLYIPRFIQSSPWCCAALPAKVALSACPIFQQAADANAQRMRQTPEHFSESRHLFSQFTDVEITKFVRAAL